MSTLAISSNEPYRQIESEDNALSPSDTSVSETIQPKIAQMQMSSEATKSSLVLKGMAFVVSGLKIAAETVQPLGRVLSLAIGSILAPVNLGIAGINAYDLAKNRSEKSKEQIAVQSGLIAGNLALATSGIALIESFFASSSAALTGLKVAKVASGAGLFILGAVHIGKVIASLAKLKNAPPEERKDLILEIVHNLISAAGLSLLGFVMVGALSASAATPAGWIAGGLILIGFVMEAIHKKAEEKAIENQEKPVEIVDIV